MAYKNDSLLQVITEKEQWSELLREIGDFDFYHTYDYHYLSKSDNEKPILLYSKVSNWIIALPLLIRPIKNSDYFDATSVYGYAGPLTKNITDDFDFKPFQVQLNSFFKQMSIVSVFTRLNPFIEHQESVLGNLGNIETLGKVVYIDLTQPMERQMTEFSRTTKRYLKKARKLCYTKVSTDRKDILRFIELYYETMDRVGAEDEYYFNQKYFFDFLDSSDFKPEIHFVVLRQTHEIIAAAMMVKTNNSIIQYHISGTQGNYLKISPMRLLIDDVRARGSKEDYHFFNLGGGLGGRDDSLLQFKSSLSKNYRMFKIWKYIVCQEIYDQLCSTNEKSHINGNKDFFPLYRLQ